MLKYNFNQSENLLTTCESAKEAEDNNAFRYNSPSTFNFTQLAKVAGIV